MNIDRFTRLLEHLYALGIERQAYIPVLAWGESGVGKSESVKRAAGGLEVDFVDLRLGQQEIGDLIGLPREETVYPCPSAWRAVGARPSQAIATPNNNSCALPTARLRQGAQPHPRLCRPQRQPL